MPTWLASRKGSDTCRSCEVRRADTVGVCPARVPDPLARYARECASMLLAGREAALARAETAARTVEAAAKALRRPRPEMLVASAYLHDIGTSEQAVRSGLPSVDGAVELLSMGWPDPVISLVAHQLQSRMIARYLDAGPQLALITRIQGWPADILDYAILTTGADGAIRPVEEGLAAVEREQAAEPRIPDRIARERLGRLARAGSRVRDALTRP